MNQRSGVGVLCAFLCVLLLSACVSLVSPYDPVFDQSLNKLSDDTAVFVAAASVGGNERNFASRETVAYYASTYNVLDRLSERARLTRGAVPCPTNAELKSFEQSPTSRSPLPDDFMQFDCREYQLYAVRHDVDGLYFFHERDGTLNRSEVRTVGFKLQAAIISAIGTFVANKSAA
jgi:hypothetical protein